MSRVSLWMPGLLTAVVQVANPHKVGADAFSEAVVFAYRPAPAALTNRATSLRPARKGRQHQQVN